MTFFYVAGWGSGAGKSTICEGLIKWVLSRGLTPAYIKPVTQCEAITPVAEFCQEHNIACIPIGPVVFRSGVTSDAIRAVDIRASRDDFLHRAKESVLSLARDASTVVVVDGVGYPSVGTCAGCGNGDVAASVGAHVILVCPDGLGDALDTMELMIAYFLNKGCTVAAVVFNRVKDTARHKRSDVEPLIAKYLSEMHPSIRLLGFVRHDDALMPTDTMVNFDGLLDLL